QPTDDCGQPHGKPIQGVATVTICLAYHECPAEPVPVLVSGCENERACAPSVTRERYRVLVRKEEPVLLGLDPKVCQALTGTVDEATHDYAVVDSIGVGERPMAVAVHPNAHLALVLNEKNPEKGTATPSLQIIDLTNHHIIATLNGTAAGPFRSHFRS